MADKIDKLVHEPARYKIMAHLYVVEAADALFLQRQTELTWGNLSSHMKKLEDARYVKVKKEFILKKLEATFHEQYLRCPNLVEEDVPAGDKEANIIIRQIGEQQIFSFPIKHHVELGEALGWFDFETAAKITGNNFALYKGDAVKLL